MTHIRAIRIDHGRNLISRPTVRRDTDASGYHCFRCPRRGTIPVVDGASIVGFDDFQDIRRPHFIGRYGADRYFGR